MILKKIGWICLLLTFLSLSCPPSSRSGTKLDLKPKIAASWLLDTNFFRGEFVEREVWNYLIQPGIELGFEAPKTKVSFDFTLDINEFDVRDDGVLDPALQDPLTDDDLDFVGYTGLFGVSYKALDRLLIGLDNSLYRTRDPAQTDPLNNFRGRELYIINRLTPYLFYEFEHKFSLGLRYRNTITDYDRDLFSDITENRVMFDLIYNFTRRSLLDLEYQYWATDFDREDFDYSSNQLKLIFRQQFKAFAIEAGGGYQSRRIKGLVLDEIDVFTYRVAVTAQNPPAPETRRSHISFVAESNLNDLDIAGRYFIGTRLSLDAGYVFLEKIPVGLNAFYQRSSFQNVYGLTAEGLVDRRIDDTFDISGRVGYLFKQYLTFWVTGGHERRDSNLFGRSFDNNYVTVSLEFGYPISRQ
jgi:hypothetical protein